MASYPFRCFLDCDSKHVAPRWDCILPFSPADSRDWIASPRKVWCLVTAYRILFERTNSVDNPRVQSDSTVDDSGLYAVAVPRFVQALAKAKRKMIRLINSLTAIFWMLPVRYTDDSQTSDTQTVRSSRLAGSCYSAPFFFLFRRFLFARKKRQR